MTWHLYIGDYAYSSWSLRGWLLFDRFGIARDQTLVDFSSQDVAAQLAKIAPATTVPAALTPEGAVIADSLALAEELATRHPEAEFWPSDPVARATARWLTAEMHSGFGALRSACPMALRVAYQDVPVSAAVAADLQKIEALWSHARAVCPSDGPWLCGAYSAADAFYAPIAARIATYNLPVGPAAQAYVAAHLADPAFRRWRAMGLVHGPDLPWYAQDHARTVWPGPTPLQAQAVEAGPAINDTCPYSGKPVTHFLQLEGRIWGFCNAFCRDKTVADPAAWPAFTALAQLSLGAVNQA